MRATRRTLISRQTRIRERLRALIEPPTKSEEQQQPATVLDSPPLVQRSPLWRSHVYIYNVSLERDFQLSPSQTRAYESILHNDQVGIERHMTNGLGSKLLKIRLGVSERTHPDGWLHEHLAARLGASVTSDPEKADFFWLPVWSYALCTAVSDRLDRVVDLDSHMQQSTYTPCAAMARVLEWLYQQPYWQRSRGADHLYIMNYKDRLSRSGRKAAADERIRNASYELVANSIFVSTEDRHAEPKLRLGVTSLVVPYYADMRKWGGGTQSFEQLIEGKNRLLTFVGNRRGKTCHLERGACPSQQSLVNGGPSVAGATRSIIQRSIEALNGTVIDLNRNSPSQMAFSDSNALLHSVFCPCPLGDTYTTKRLFTAVQSLCIPILVSDGIQLPYAKKGVAWQNFTMRVTESEILQHKVDIAGLAQVANKVRIRWMQQQMWQARHLLSFTARSAGGPPDATTMMLDELQQTRTYERVVLLERLSHEPCMHGVNFGLEHLRRRRGESLLLSQRRRAVWVTDGCGGIFAFYKDGKVCDDRPQGDLVPSYRRWCDRVVCKSVGKAGFAGGFYARRTTCQLMLHGDWTDPAKNLKKLSEIQSQLAQLEQRKQQLQHMAEGVRKSLESEGVSSR